MTGAAGDSGRCNVAIPASWQDFYDATGIPAAVAAGDTVYLTGHTGPRAQGDAVLEVAAEFLDKPDPAWTAVGVVELYEPEAVIEITCVVGKPIVQEDT